MVLIYVCFVSYLRSLARLRVVLKVSLEHNEPSSEAGIDELSLGRLLRNLPTETNECLNENDRSCRPKW